MCPCQCCCCCCCQRWPPAGEPAHCRFPAVHPPTCDFPPWRDPANCLTTACRCCATGCMLVSCFLGTCCCARSGEGRRSVMKASNCRLPGPADGVACLQGCVVHAAVWVACSTVAALLHDRALVCGRVTGQLGRATGALLASRDSRGPGWR